MKVTKTSVHRLTIEKGCGCKATREYEDVRYTKPLGEATFIACDKHKLKKDFAEFAGEMLIEALDKEAETAGKNTFVQSHRQVAEGDNAGVQATSEAGGSVQAMGMTMPPKIREKRDPLASKTATVNRDAGRLPQNRDLHPTGNLNTAGYEVDLEKEGITMDHNIDDVEADPRVDAVMQSELRQLEEIFDDEDQGAQGVPASALRQAVD